MVYLKAEILAKQGDKAGAIAAAKHSTELAEKANDAAYVRMNAELIKSLK
jgi:succinyl-CoA synthetase beta subunit